MREKRTNVDFSEHSYKIDYFRNDKGDLIRVDVLQKGNSRMNYLEFINTDNVLTVTGDFGNWVFGRPFIPSKKGYVSDGYWIQKLSLASEQNFIKLDFNLIIEELKELINTELEEQGYEGDELYKIKEWFEELLEVAEENDEMNYLYKAFRDNYSPDIDLEMIPCYKQIPVWLNIVFDGFDEMCNRYKDNLYGI